MSKKKEDHRAKRGSSLHPDTKTSVVAIILLGVSLTLILSGMNQAGPVGALLFKILNQFLGWGYWLIPSLLTLISFTLLVSQRRQFVEAETTGAIIFLVASLGLIDILYPGGAGLLGHLVGSIRILFGSLAAAILGLTIALSGLLVALNLPINIKLKPKEKAASEKELIRATIPEAPSTSPEPTEEPRLEEVPGKGGRREAEEIKVVALHRTGRNYVFPPASLLHSGVDKPTAGDLRANANIIKRTLESFGIPVEMGEITIGPKVTRYTLKPAEGVKLSKITSLNQDLSLALAAHPIRIEAPIPGKSLVGIEIPNKSASLVRLGSLLNFSEFKSSGLLGFALGRDVSGEPIFTSIAKMPHLLIAGSTGSGKSVAVHSLLISLLYKNSPETLKLILIDPKRVELSIYEGLPHLITPVITDGKKVIAALRFAIAEMEKRYQELLQSGSRDIESFNNKRPEEPMPYFLIVIDELADLMAAYGREIEGSIVRLAQMARATGIHLVVSTQRPSVEVITGLIKANITSRIALQVASQVDSRTILDASGAEKLLGGGDMLFISGELSKPKRIQGAYVTDEEISSVVKFIKTRNKDTGGTVEGEEFLEAASSDKETLEEYLGDDDELLDEAIEVVRAAKKASASLLQRRLKVGYARAARLLDIMEAKGLIGPGEGAKPREVFIKDEDY